MSKSKLLPTLCTLAAGLSMAVSGTVAAGAAPIHIPKIEAPATNVTPVNHRGMYRSGAHIYLNGHRGYRHQRHGYRHHDGWWFPPAAFALGAIIGGAIAAPPPYYGPPFPGPIYRGPVYRGSHGSAHVSWCYNRYRSYRAWDNTFQPYRGPRRLCRSPYG
jgi:hypothetical protein